MKRVFVILFLLSFSLLLNAQIPVKTPNPEGRPIGDESHWNFDGKIDKMKANKFAAPIQHKLEKTGSLGNLAHWSFESNFNDSSKNHNNGEVFNGTRFDNNGLNSSAIFVHGRDAYVTFSDSPTLDMPMHFSWVVWCNWNSNPGGYVPFFWKASKPEDSIYRNKPSYGLWVYQDHIHAGVLTKDFEWIEAVSPLPVKSNGNWHVICVTYDGKKLQVYYDVFLVAEAKGQGGPIYNSNQKLNLARIQQDGEWKYFLGRMDELGFYDFAFTPEQVKSVWNSQNGILPKVKE